MKNKLNIGCGNDIKEGFVNLDIAQLPGVDVVCDIDKNPLPFESNTFEYIICYDILEHIDYPKVLKEIHRVLAVNGVVEIRVPHFTSSNNFIDPTHKKMFSFRTFNFFTNGALNNREYYYDFHFKEVIDSKITFINKNPVNWPFIILVNLNNTTRKIYEETFLRSIAPALNIEIKLLK
ncbi:class I SAM-dependent methyltransferase [Flavobacterium luteum]|uniref:Methyltransferase domain-containing protein n=1 Tax=Flavobacterium luteum TaxID=2026654 RepID=A0A7J5AHG3_9FLAO|nr:methyltransferase domain-containing protein [Flavobacterium luteum]KAB1157057.1 methyltransferase domain-containing protein [Flavobacterium luteum]